MSIAAPTKSPIRTVIPVKPIAICCRFKSPIFFKAPANIVTAVAISIIDEYDLTFDIPPNLLNNIIIADKSPIKPVIPARATAILSAGILDITNKAPAKMPIAVAMLTNVFAFNWF